jgi:hypothetical protein
MQEMAVFGSIFSANQQAMMQTSSLRRFAIYIGTNSGQIKHFSQVKYEKNALTYCFYWCPEPDSNRHDLSISGF